MANIVESENLKFAYISEEGAYQFALNGVSISIQEGEFVAILGHNGSGKSTFAKLVNALNTPTDGRITVDGMDTREEDALFDIRRTAGMVFQNPDNQLVATVVDEDVAFGPENLGIPREEIIKRVQTSLDAVGMSAYAHRAPHMLSGGQKQRVAIAGALAMRPKLIVFDEATAMLDPRGRGEIMDIIKKLNRQEGMTILLITHYMEEAAQADRAIVLSGGVVLAQGAPHDILCDRKLLSEAGLLPPFAAALAMDLREGGIELGENPILTQELVEALCRLQ